MSIGRFSEATRLSVKALRLYDERGLLRPEHVDQTSGYRYYGPSQVAKARAIRLLRSADMSLDDIGSVLSSNPTRRDEMMRQHLERLEKNVRSQRQKLAAFSDIAEGRKPLVPYEISEKRVPTQHVASVTKEVSLETVAQTIGEGFGTIMGTIGGRGIGPAGAPFLVMLDVIDEEMTGSIQICIPVPGPFEDAGPVDSVEMPEATVAATLHKGAYDEVTPAYHAISSWMADNGWEPAGPPREIYLNDPTEVTVSEQLTEVQWPITKSS